MVDSSRIQHTCAGVVIISLDNRKLLALVKKDGMPELARKIQSDLRSAAINSFYDQSGAIGRRYRRQDEVGTPWCITVDGESLEKGTVTIRDRDTLEQVRISMDQVVTWIQEQLS